MNGFQLIGQVRRLDGVLQVDYITTSLLAPMRRGGLDLIGKAAVLKTAGLTPLRVRVPRPPPEDR